MRPGYKQTEVGVIPEDWDTVKIGSLGIFSKGQGVRKNEAESGDIPCIRYGEIYTHHNDIVRSFNSYTSAEVAKSSKQLKKGDLLFAGSGETKEDIGKCVAFVRNEECYAGGDIVILSPSKGDSKFLGYLINAPIIVRQKASKGQGDAIVHIGVSALASITIPLPPTKAEQEAIAEALSDADALIESLEQLIAKKQQIKQGAMQELLTGKKRLPGFAPIRVTGRSSLQNAEYHGIPNGWKMKLLGNVLTIAHGKSQHNVADPNGTYPILATGGQIGKAKHFLYDKPSVLIGRKGTINQPQFMNTPFWSVDTLFYSVVHDPNNAKFLYYKFCLIDWRQYNEASGVPSLNARTIESIEILIPQHQEQTAIATVLSDMDTELATLETKLTKARQLKQGMMQELLTGRVRLVPPTAVALRC